MPRGVYDRTKTKAQREAEKAAKGAAPAAKVKGKPGRKPGSKVTKSASPTKTAESRASYGGDALGLFATVRANIETLTIVQDKFGTTIPTVGPEIAAHVEIMTNLRKQVFGSGEKQAKTESTETVVETAPASNGTTAAAPQYQSTVPMPPAPIPSMPTVA